MEDFVNGLFVIALLCLCWWYLDKVNEIDENKVVDYVYVCDIEKCTIYEEEQIEEVREYRYNTDIYLVSGEKISTSNENVIVYYKENN